MNDCEGKRIALGSVITIVNDVAYGNTFKVERFCDVHPILGIQENGIFIPLSTYATDDNGNLIDFRRK